MNNTLPLVATAEPDLWSQVQTWHTITRTLDTLAAGFAPISLKQMAAVALLDRLDIKYVMTTDQLRDALAALQADYWILDINGWRLNHYRTLYFDTPEFELYTAHVTGRAERYKVRSREYVDTRLSFLEVKHHTRTDRTVKARLATARPVIQPTSDMKRWLHDVSPLDGSRLEPKLWNTFTRLTLVSRHSCERVTLDVDLTFYTDATAAQLHGLVIAEVKMDRGSSASPFLAQMRAQRIQPRGFSKYALGVALLYDRVKKNTLKPKLLWLDKLLMGVNSHA